jgi:hypothetical protein
MRQRLSDASRATYERHFTLAAHLPTYERLIQAAVAEGARVAS